jgi:hypothetical protein
MKNPFIELKKGLTDDQIKQMGEILDELERDYVAVYGKKVTTDLKPLLEDIRIKQKGGSKRRSKRRKSKGRKKKSMRGGGWQAFIAGGIVTLTTAFLYKTIFSRIIPSSYDFIERAEYIINKWYVDEGFTEDMIDSLKERVQGNLDAVRAAQAQAIEESQEIEEGQLANATLFAIHNAVQDQVSPESYQRLVTRIQSRDVLDLSGRISVMRSRLTDASGLGRI